MNLKLIKADENLFKEHQENLLDIYIESVTTGVMEQYLDRQEEGEHMLDMFRSGGYGYFAMDDEKLIGFMIASPLDHDDLLPNLIKQKFPVEKCLYIAEMDVSSEYRGQGIGSKLLKKFIDDIDREKWEYLFIRAWRDNVKAIEFYKRFGFELGDIINQEKVKPDKVSKFMIEKQYLWQKL